MEPLHFLQPGGQGLLIFLFDLGQERLEGGANSAVGLEDGQGDDSGSVFCSLLALGDGGSFAHQTSGLHAEQGGNLDVNELVGVLDTWFGDSHVQSRAVFGVDGRVVREDFDVCTKARSSRNVRNFVSQSVVPHREGVSAGACRRVFAFLVKGGSALGSVALLVFAPITAVAHSLTHSLSHSFSLAGFARPFRRKADASWNGSFCSGGEENVRHDHGRNNEGQGNKRKRHSKRV